MTERIQAELQYLRTRFPDLEYVEAGQWVRLPRYGIPEGIWDRSEVAVAFQIPPGHPGQKPYGFWVSPRIRLISGQAIQNGGESSEPPFSGEWFKFSWDVPEWRPTADLKQGDNMLNYALTLWSRLKEGA